MKDLVTTDAAKPVVVQRLLGQGGQGEVFLAELEGRPYALKLYHPDTSTGAQRAAIERLVAKGSPDRYFLWPEHLVDDPSGRRFGYLMPLREPRFRPTEDLMARRVTPSLRALVDAAIQLADAFLKLHARGLCYRDISFGNVFLDPATGDVRVCDNDNVDLAGAAAGVYGTPRFMAPEIVRGEAAPSDDTDRFSLGVLLFYLLFGGHPLDGQREANIRCLDTPALNRLYGSDPVYIFDPRHTSNRPVPGLHDNPLAFVRIYPRALLDAFERAFTAGLGDPGTRLRESEWRKVFARVRDRLGTCACGADVFFEEGMSCWRCGHALPRPPALRLDGADVALQAGVELFPHHLQRLPYDYSQPLARVTPHPADASRLGLQNLGTEDWTFTRPDGTTVDVPPGRAAPLVAGNRLHFGRIDGDVVAG